MHWAMDIGAIAVECFINDIGWWFAAVAGGRTFRGKSLPMLCNTHIFFSRFSHIFSVFQEAKKLGFDRSLFTRIQDAYIGSEIKPNVYSLREQFRMHPDICHFSNQYFYKQKLTTNPIAIDYFFRLNPYNVFSLDFLQSIADKYNYHNTEEADFVIEILKVAKEYADPKAYSYGIITPYSAQKEQIVKRLRYVLFEWKISFNQLLN